MTNKSVSRSALITLFTMGETMNPEPTLTNYNRPVQGSNINNTPYSCDITGLNL